jgi:hypothetical protein
VSTVCPECGAAISDGGLCRDHFHALLLLESEIPGGPSALPHFLAVASYGLQHPGGMNYTAEALAGLRAAVADVLDGRLTISRLLRRTRRHVDGAVCITRRAGEGEVSWHRDGWPVTVADVCAGGVEGYADRVLCWARSVREVLDADVR